MAKKRFFQESELVFKEKPTHCKFKDLEGQKFGKLTVLGYAGQSIHSQWFCKCECENIIQARITHLKNGHTGSCGCLQKERTTKHGHAKSGKTSRIYTTWQSMLDRCQNHNCKAFKDYGGRGITVCERWQKFENFLADMGEVPKGLTLDRIENDKGYYKENCRWATMKEQGNNRRNNRFITFNGKTQTITEWGSEIGMTAVGISGRLIFGWSVEEALTTPPKIKHSKNAKSNP